MCKGRSHDQPKIITYDEREILDKMNRDEETFQCQLKLGKIVEKHLQQNEGLSECSLSDEFRTALNLYRKYHQHVSQYI